MLEVVTFAIPTQHLNLLLLRFAFIRVIWFALYIELFCRVQSAVNIRFYLKVKSKDMKTNLVKRVRRARFYNSRDEGLE